MFILSLKVNSALGLLLCSSPTMDIFTALQLLRCYYSSRSQTRAPQCHFLILPSLIHRKDSLSVQSILSMFLSPSLHPEADSLPLLVTWLWSQSTEATADCTSGTLPSWKSWGSVTRPVCWMPFPDILKSAQRVLWKDLSAGCVAMGMRQD